jgi:predicted metal-dependent hydrolase
LLRGIEQFNRGEYFEQHETLEDLWSAEPDDVRYLYQGILQVGVGLYHLQRSNYSGVVSKLRSGVEKLRWFEPVCQSVDVAALVEDAARCLEALEALGLSRIAEFDWSLAPKIHVSAVGAAGEEN